MRRLKYQLKNIRRDKLCLLTFLLPIVVGALIRALPALNFQAMNEISFGSVQGDLSEEMSRWLQDSGNLTEYENVKELKAAVNDPATQLIGVLRAGNGLRVFLSGDEFEMYRTIGETLPQLYEKRADRAVFSKKVIPASEDFDGMKSLLIVITLVTAMFMGCTFNSMNMIGEKEDGVSLVNQILPMDARTYIFQKLALGCIGGIASTLATAFLCVRILPRQMAFLFLLVTLSAYFASLIGLLIGHFSSGMMAGIGCIKIIMILFLAPPVVFYLLTPADSLAYRLSYLFPSSAAFYGLMGLLNGQGEKWLLHLGILFAHAVFLTIVSKKAIFAS